MKKNMGTADRVIRTMIAVILGVLLLAGSISGTLATVLSIIAIIFLLTSAVGFCPLYAIVGVSTMKQEAK